MNANLTDTSGLCQPVPKSVGYDLYVYESTNTNIYSFRLKLKSEDDAAVAHSSSSTVVLEPHSPDSNDEDETGQQKPKEAVSRNVPLRENPPCRILKYNIPVDMLDKATKERLEGKQTLSSKQRRALIQAIYDDVSVTLKHM